MAQAHLKQGDAYVEQGQWDEAITEYSKAIELDPELAEAYSSRGYAYVCKLELDKAMADCNRAIELDPNFARAYYNRGYAYLEKGEVIEAISDLGWCISVSTDPELVEAAKKLLKELEEVHQALPIYQDDFSEPNSGWQQTSEEAYENGYENGEYYILVKKSDWSAWVWNENTEVFEDFTIEVDARLVSGSEQSSYGIIFRWVSGGGFYRFLVSGSGYYSVGAKTDNVWTELHPCTESAFIKRGNSTNHLQVVCRGSEIGVWVNGYYLTTVIDDSLAAGWVGMIVSTTDPNTRVAFDNIIVYSAD
jgi:hypothetical protein